jgi:succinate dehydrogenase/fumarate reductase iron-sulfur protein
MAVRSIAVERFNPDVDRGSYWETFSVDLADNLTILDVLLTIADAIDPTLAFRRTCRSGICGACAGVVNDRPCLFCQRSIGEAAESAPAGMIRLAPLRGFPVLRDLVVDMEEFFQEFDRLDAWLVPDASYGGVLRADEADKLWSVATCVLCGICSPPDAEVRPHPAAIARLMRLAHDPRDARGRERLATLSSSTIQISARVLREVCPKRVDITTLME